MFQKMAIYTYIAQDRDIQSIEFTVFKNINLLSIWSFATKSKRKAMNRNWCNQKTNPALNTKAGNK